MTNSRFRNNGQPINIAVAIRRAGKHENDVDAVVADPRVLHWRARDNRSKWETEGERATKTRTVFPSWLISTRFRIRTRRRLDRSCHLDSRLDGKPVVISIFHFARATLPLPPSQRLITTKRRFPFPPTQNFPSLLFRP